VLASAADTVARWNRVASPARRLGGKTRLHQWTPGGNARVLSRSSIQASAPSSQVNRRAAKMQKSSQFAARQSGQRSLLIEEMNVGATLILALLSAPFVANHIGMASRGVGSWPVTGEARTGLSHLIYTQPYGWRSH